MYIAFFGFPLFGPFQSSNPSVQPRFFSHPLHYQYLRRYILICSIHHSFEKRGVTPKVSQNDAENHPVAPTTGKAHGNHHTEIFPSRHTGGMEHILILGRQIYSLDALADLRWDALGKPPAAHHHHHHQTGGSRPEHHVAGLDSFNEARNSKTTENLTTPYSGGPRFGSIP